MRRTVYFSIVVALVIAGGSLALAAIPNGDNTFFGCYSNNHGDLRLIDKEAGQTCTKQETEVFWNQTGPTGPTGATGEQGPPGVVQVETSRLSELPGRPEPQDIFLPTDNNLHERLTIQTFTTQTAGSLVTITMQAPARASSQVDDTSCMFQLRVDGHTDTGETSGSRSANQSGLAALLAPVGRENNAPLHISAYFEGLAAGEHVLALWVAGFPGTTCYFNPGNFIIVTHIEEIIQSSN
jgi:hypothetical protein